MLESGWLKQESKPVPDFCSADAWRQFGGSFPFATELVRQTRTTWHGNEGRRDFQNRFELHLPAEAD